MSGIRWLAGEPALCARIERAWSEPAADGAEATVLRDRPGRRRLTRLRWHEGPDLFVKLFYMSEGRHRTRKALVRALGIEAARREWRALTRLAAAGVAVPTPRALGILPGGDRLLAVDHLEGRPLETAWQDPPRDLRTLARELGRLVAGLHGAGVAHRDLHAGNVLLTGDGPVLIDLQLAGRGGCEPALLRDLGELDASLADALSLGQRVRLRAAALGLARPFDADARALLRAAGRASLRRAQVRAASRRRRALRPGRRFATVRLAGLRGLRVRELAPRDLETALSNEAGAMPPRDRRARTRAVEVGGRRLLVEEYGDGGGRTLLDLLRGSPGRRAWLAAFGLEAHGLETAPALAFLERRVLGLPLSSTLVLEEPGPALGAAEAVARDGPAALDELARLARRLHARGILHRGLGADTVGLGPDGPRLGGLSEVRFRERLSDGERRHDLARLDAALRGAVDAGTRRRAFARYALWLPFAEPPARACARITRESQAEALSPSRP